MRPAAIVLLLLAAYCEAKPSFDYEARATFGSSYIVGGEEAGIGEFPWQLSQQRLSSSWSHSCGASLLSERYALSAAHCVDGAAVKSLRVIAGLHDRTSSYGVVSDLVSYTMHENYNNGPQSFANDIAILTLTTPISANGGTIQYASLPDNNDDLFVGRTCVMSGWGRTSSSNVLPIQLQKASIGIISMSECNKLLSSVIGAKVVDAQVCLYDTETKTGSCNGDSGGPLNCNYPTANDYRRVVYGVTSWGVSGRGVCMQTYPSVYTRVSAYLGWILDNTPQ